MNASTAEILIERCFALDPAVRYVAVYRNGELQSRQRAGLANASEGESDRYEELIVNPTLLTLTRQRGNIDCGGLNYVLIRYGSFFEFVHPFPGGHLSVGLEPDGEILRVAGRLERLVHEWAPEPPAPFAADATATARGR